MNEFKGRSFFVSIVIYIYDERGKLIKSFKKDLSD